MILLKKHPKIISYKQIKALEQKSTKKVSSSQNISDKDILKKIEMNGTGNSFVTLKDHNVSVS